MPTVLAQTGRVEMFCFLTYPCRHTWRGERLRGQEGAVIRWRDVGMQGCTEGCGRHWWPYPPPGVLWPLITPQRPRTPPAPTAVGSQWEDVALNSCRLSSKSRGRVLLLVLPKLDENKSYIAASITTTSVNCVFNVPVTFLFYCVSCLVIPDFLICICICLFCCTFSQNCVFKQMESTYWVDPVFARWLTELMKPEKEMISWIC